MKKIIIFCSSILTAILIVLACNTKEVVLVTNVELDFSQNTTNSGFVNDLLPATFIITPEAFLPEFEYYIKYEVLEGQGVFLNGDEEEIPEGEDILLTKLEEETNFSLPLTYKGLRAGNHRVKITARDNFDKSIEVILNYTINNLPILWTAEGSADQLTLGSTTTATVTLQNNTNAQDLTFVRSYAFSEGTGRLLDTSGATITQNQTVAISPGVFLITIEPATLGTNTITFDLEDSNGQLLNNTITIEVLEEDITPPIISLTGPNPFQITVGDTYTEQGATATDNVDGTFPVPASGIIGTVDTNTIGEYIISYNASDAAGNAAVTVTRTVNVVEENTPDTEAPIITLNGPASIDITLGDTYTEQGATATDNVDGTFPVPASGITGTVDTSIAGPYTITYNASDIAGNAAITVTRTINVIEDNIPDTEAPVITLNGPATMDITVGDTYTEQGATATDNIDGIFPVPASGIVGTVDTNTIGEYTISYDAADAAGNSAITVTRTVNVVEENTPDTDPPIITLNGPATIDITVGDTYIEQGATATDNIDGTFPVPASGISGTVDTSIAGPYTITYNVSDAAGNPAATVTRTINVTFGTEDPIVIITALPISGVAPLTVSFDGSESLDDGTITNYLWNFDENGATSTQVSPTYTFNTIGTYNVILQLTDNDGNESEDSITITVNENAPNTEPELTLSATPTNGTAPLTVQFTADGFDADGDTLAYAWDFGDGTTSTLEDPTHTFTTASATPYNITLIISDGNGGTANDSVSIIVNPVPNTAPTVNLTATPTSGDAPLDVQFSSNVTDPDVGDTLTYSWSFGDGNTSTEANPVHQYTSADNSPYTVLLTVSDGTVTVSDATSITVSAPNNPPIVDITSNVISNNSIVPFEIDFDANASDPDGDNLTYLWDFGDGNTATTENTSNEYTTAGTFEVTLTVSDGTNSVIDTETVTAIANQLPTAVVNSTLSQINGAPDTINFSAAGSGDIDGTIVGYQWNFGDIGSSNNTPLTTVETTSHTYQNAGTYTITLRVTDDKGGLSAAATTNITIPEANNPPVATNFTRSIEEGESVVTPASFVASDLDGDTLTISGVEPVIPSQGSTTIAANNLSFTYTAPSSGAPFTVQIDYTVSDGTATDTGTMTVSVTDSTPTGPCAGGQPLPNCGGTTQNCGTCQCWEFCP